MNEFDTAAAAIAHGIPAGTLTERKGRWWVWLDKPKRGISTTSRKEAVDWLNSPEKVADAAVAQGIPAGTPTKAHGFWWVWLDNPKRGAIKSSREKARQWLREAKAQQEDAA